MMGSYTCAMCGDSAGSTAPYSAITVPPACLELMQNGYGIDTDDVVGKVHVDLCKEDAEIAKRMVNEYETSPLPECDANAARYDSRPDLEDGPGHDNHDLAVRMFADAVDTVTAAESGRADHLPDTDIFEAKAVELSLQLLDRPGLKAVVGGGD